MLSLTRWNPLRDLTSLHRDMDDLFRQSFRDFGRFMTEETGYPALECYVKDKVFTVKALIPGVDPNDIHISVMDNRLSIKGETKKDTNIKEEQYMLHEFRYGAFERTITIPEGVEIEKLHASFENGTLMITAPAKEAAKPKRIEIEVSSKKSKAA
jgi:HSP20 family protein